MANKSLQDTYAPKTICFGCGPANTQGLQIKSFVQGDEVVAQWRAQPHHQAFPGILGGGIIGALLDCHCNWAAVHHLMNLNQLDHPPCTVTSVYAIKLMRPTPIDGVIELRAKVISATNDRATVFGELSAAGKVCASCEATFIAVKEGHPAFARW